MDQYCCKRCGNVVTRGENHFCYFEKKFGFNYFPQEPIESDGNLGEVKDKSTENSNSSVQVIEVKTYEDASSTEFSENVETNNKRENDVFETGNRAQFVTESSGIDIQNQNGSSASNRINVTTEDESKMCLENSKSRSLLKDKIDFMASLGCVIRNALSDNNDISGTANTTVNPDLSTGSSESKNDNSQLSQDVNDENISSEVQSDGQNKKKKIATFVKEPMSAEENDIAVAGPSGFCSGNKDFRKTCSRKDSLKTNNRTSTSEKAFLCDICKMQFSTKSNRNRHYKIHTGVKPYVCDICGKEFNQKGNRDSHYLLHNGDGPFSCEVCKKSFAYKSCLLIHIRKHTGERPYKCQFCEMSFRTSSHRSMHHKRKHQKN